MAKNKEMIKLKKAIDANNPRKINNAFMKYDLDIKDLFNVADDFDSSKENTWSPLCWALYGHRNDQINIEVITTLLKAGYDPNVRLRNIESERGTTLLHLVAIRHHHYSNIENHAEAAKYLEVAKLLVEYGADLTLKSQHMTLAQTGDLKPAMENCLREAEQNQKLKLQESKFLTELDGTFNEPALLEILFSFFCGLRTSYEPEIKLIGDSANSSDVYSSDEDGE